MKRLLMVVDYQNDFVDGALGFPGAEKLEKPIADKIAAYREAGDEVAFTFDTHRRDYLDTQEGKNLPVAHCVEGTPGHDLYGQVADCLRDSDTVFCKPAFGRVLRALPPVAACCRRGGQAAVREHRDRGPGVQHLHHLERRAGKDRLPRGARHRGRRLHGLVRPRPSREGPRRHGRPPDTGDQPLAAHRGAPLRLRRCARIFCLDGG